jgi:DNA modification methylase
MAKKAKPARPVPKMKIPPAQWAGFTVERRALSQLKPHPRNAKRHPQEQVELLTESFAEHGVVRPFVIDENDVILAGHGGTAGVGRFGAQVAEVPVVVVRGWSEEQKLAFMLRDNKLGELGKWDKTLLGLQLVDLAKIPGIDLGLVGFKTAELDRLLPKGERAGLTDPDDAPDAADRAVSQPGDLWLLGEHRLLCGDSTKAADVAAVLENRQPHLMVTDPPYGVEYDPDWRNQAAYENLTVGGDRAVGRVMNDDRADWREAWALFGGDVAYVWHSALHAGTFEESLRAVGFEQRAQIIWAKDGMVVSRGHYHWQHEPCLYVVRKGATGHWAGDWSQTTLWEIPRPKKSETGHGTQKPVECMKRPMHNNSREGDFVYEPFSGSGTTIIAGEQTGRRVLAIEINPVYVDVAVRRWEAFSGKKAIHASGEWTFAQAAEARGVPLVAAA